LVKGLEAFKGGLVTFLVLAEVLVQTPMGGAPGVEIPLAQLPRRILPEEWMGVDGDELAGASAAGGKQLHALQALEGQVALGLTQIDERFGQAGDGRRAPQGSEAVGSRGAVEEAQKAKDGGERLVFCSCFQPMGVGVHNAEGMAALLFGIGFRESDEVAAADVAPMGISEIGTQEVEREGVTFDVLDELSAFLLRAANLKKLEECDARFAGKTLECDFGGRSLSIISEIRDREAGGDDAEAVVASEGQGPEESGERVVFETAVVRWAGRILEGLDTVENEYGALLRDEMSEAFGLFGGVFGAIGGFFVAEKRERRGEEGVRRGGGLIPRALTVEGPREGGFAVGPVLMGQIGKPFGDEGSFAFAAKGDEGEDVRTFGCACDGFGPGFVEEGEFGLATNEFFRGVPVDAGRCRSGRPCTAAKRLVCAVSANREPGLTRFSRYSSVP
jgi:hypothetical protein